MRLNWITYPNTIPLVIGKVNISKKVREKMKPFMQVKAYDVIENSPAATWEDEERITFHSDMPWISEIHHFLGAIVDDTDIAIGNSADALKLMKIIDKIYQNG